MQKKDSDLASMIEYLHKNLAKRRKTFSLHLHQHEHFYLDEHGLLYHVWSPTGRRRTATKSQLAVPANLRFDKSVS